MNESNFLFFLIQATQEDPVQNEGSWISDGSEELVASIKNRYKFLEPKFFTLRKIMQSTESKKRNDIGILFACRNCPNGSISAGVSSASNLRRHIKLKHPGHLKEYDEAWAEQKKQKGDKRPMSKNAEEDTPTKRSKMTQLKLFEVTQEQIDKKILRFVLETNQASRVVEAESFKDLLRLSAGTADKKIMTRKTLRSRISNKFGEMLTNIKAELEKASCCCITADIWSRFGIHLY